MRQMDGLLHAILFPEDEIDLIETFEMNGSFIHESLTPEQEQWVQQFTDRALACEDAEERRQTLLDMEKRMLEEAQLLFLFHGRFQLAAPPAYRGVGISPHGWIEFKEVWRD
ncbi:hypothetical protein [Paenibacillus sp. NPDC058071]|uniref:hypothetical protein n=1 Tax=Paenibacillus sp. NPDC058071 TaxID=3346326 RepID=UPI0036DD2B2B